MRQKIARSSRSCYETAEIALAWIYLRILEVKNHKDDI